jgi:hypothetical protein
LIFVIVLCMLRALQWQRLLCPRLQGDQRRDSTDRWRHRDPCVVLDTNLITKTSLEEMYGIWENWRRRENCQMACRWIYQSSSTGTYLVSRAAAVCDTYVVGYNPGQNHLRHSIKTFVCGFFYQLDRNNLLVCPPPPPKTMLDVLSVFYECNWWGKGGDLLNLR